MDTHQDSDNVHHDSGVVHQDTGEVDKSAYSLTVEAAASKIREAGFTCSDRTVSRWCSPSKGILQCTLVPLENGRIERWFVTPESVEIQIQKMRNVSSFSAPSHDTSHPDTSGYNEIHQDTASHDEVADEVQKKIEELETRATTLEEENFNLRVENMAQKEVSRQARDQIDRAGELLRVRDKEIGKLEYQLLQLEAPGSAHTAVSNNQQPDGTESNRHGTG